MQSAVLAGTQQLMLYIGRASMKRTWLLQVMVSVNARHQTDYFFWPDIEFKFYRLTETFFFWCHFDAKSMAVLLLSYNIDFEGSK